MSSINNPIYLNEVIDNMDNYFSLFTQLELIANLHAHKRTRSALLDFVEDVYGISRSAANYYVSNLKYDKTVPKCFIEFIYEQHKLHLENKHRHQYLENIHSKIISKFNDVIVIRNIDFRLNSSIEEKEGDTNLDYKSMWNDLYTWTSHHSKDVASMMKKMMHSYQDHQD